MIRRILITALIAASLSLVTAGSAVAALDAWGSTTANPFGPGKGATTTIVKLGGLWQAECPIEVANWKLVSPNEKIESNTLLFEVEKYSECQMTTPEKAAVTFSACAYEIKREVEILKGIAFSLTKSCSVKIATSKLACEVVMPATSNTALKSLEVVNLKEPARVEFLAGVNNLVAEVKGTKCGELKSVTNGELLTDKLFAEQLVAH